MRFVKGLLLLGATLLVLLALGEVGVRLFTNTVRPLVSSF